MPPQYQRPSKMDEYQKFQQGQAAQQAQMMQMLTQMYGIGERQQVLPGELQRTQLANDAQRLQNEHMPAQYEQQGVAAGDTHQAALDIHALSPQQLEYLKLQNEQQRGENAWQQPFNEQKFSLGVDQGAHIRAQSRNTDMNTAGNAIGYGLANIDQGRALAGQNNPAYVQSIQDKVKEAELTREQGRAVEDARNAGPQPPLPPATNNEVLQRVFQQGRFNPYANETVGQELGRKTGDVLGAVGRTLISPFAAAPRAIGHKLRQKKNDEIKSGPIPFIPPKGNFWDY